MSYRDLFVTFTILATLPFCFARPWIGILVWSWIGYMNPHRLTWGFAYNQPFAMMVAIATLSGLLFTRDRKPLPRTSEVYLLFMLFGMFVLSSFYAIQQKAAWEQFDKVWKILLVTMVTMLLFQSAYRLRMLLLVIALSIGFFGFKGGLWSLSTGGGNQVLGPPDSFIAGNTEIGLALNMVIPILLLLSRDEPRRWLRYLLRAMFFFSIIGTLFTYSRGAVMGLMVIVPLMFLKSRLKLLVLPLIFCAYLWGEPIAEAIFPEQWMARMGTVQTYEKDQSANMRLNSWRVAYLLAVDNPLTGAGFRPFSPAIYLQYSPDERWNDMQDAHSIYLQVLAEHGFVGFGLYCALIVSTLVSLRRIMWRARGRPSLAFHGRAAQMLEVSFVGFLVSGTFLSMSYFDLFFHLVAVTVMLKVLVLQAEPEPAPAAPPPSPVLRTRVPVPRPALVRRTL